MRLHDYLEFHARETPEQAYAQFDGRTVSYRDANRRANRIAHALTKSGLERGDRFGYLSKNSADFALMYFGASKVGVIPVPLNYRLAPREWLYILNDAGGRMLIGQAEFVDGINHVRNELAVEQFVVLDGAGDGWTRYDDWLSSDES